MWSPLRNRAETTLLDVRRHDGRRADEAFAEAASTRPTARSGAEGGHLGWLSASDRAPSLPASCLVTPKGVLPVGSAASGVRVVEVLERISGVEQAFESVRGAVAMALRQQAYVTALRQYLSFRWPPGSAARRSRAGRGRDAAGSVIEPGHHTDASFGLRFRK